MLMSYHIGYRSMLKVCFQLDRYASLSTQDQVPRFAGSTDNRRDRWDASTSSQQSIEFKVI